MTVAYNPRDLIDNRVYIQHADVEHPYLHLVQHSNGEWNFKEIFAGPKTTRAESSKDLNTRGWGDYFVVDSARTRNATFLLTLPWHPDDSLRGVSRDSVIRAHLTNPAKAVTKTFDGYGRTYAWRNAHGLISHARLADPDSDKKFGQQFRVDSIVGRRVRADVQVPKCQRRTCGIREIRSGSTSRTSTCRRRRERAAAKSGGAASRRRATTSPSTAIPSRSTT